MRTATRFSLAALLVAVAVPASPASAQSEFTNWFTALPAFTADTFTIVLKGDQTALIPAQNALSTLTDPFAFNLSQTPTITVSLDAQGNTEIVYKGAPIAPGTSFPYPNNQPHFGLNGGGSQPAGGFHVLSKIWSNSGVPADQSPVAALSFFVTPPPGAGPVQFLNVFAQFGGVGEWFESPFLFQPGQLPVMHFTDDTNTPLTLSNVGFFVSDTQIPLDQLNFDTLPPPDQPGSKFALIPGLDGVVLDANGGGISAVAAVPEPGVLTSSGVCLLGLLGYLSCRRGLRAKG